MKHVLAALPLEVVNCPYSPSLAFMALHPEWSCISPRWGGGIEVGRSSGSITPITSPLGPLPTVSLPVILRLGRDVNRWIWWRGTRLLFLIWQGQGCCIVAGESHSVFLDCWPQGGLTSIKIIEMEDHILSKTGGSPDIIKNLWELRANREGTISCHCQLKFLIWCSPWVGDSFYWT